MFEIPNLNKLSFDYRRQVGQESREFLFHGGPITIGTWIMIMVIVFIVGVVVWDEKNRKKVIDTILVYK
jgi:hypothetical protein